MEDSLLYCMLSNELEIAGLRATQSSYSEQSRLSSFSFKRLHLDDGTSAVPLSSSPPVAQTCLRDIPSPTGSFKQDDSSGDNGPVYTSQVPTRKSSRSSNAHVSHSAPASTDAVSKLKQLLARSSAVRQSAVTLLLQSKQVAAQASTRQPPTLDDRWNAATAASVSAEYPNPATTLQTTELSNTAAPAAASRLLRNSPPPSSLADVHPGSLLPKMFPPQQAPCIDDFGEGSGDWVTDLEDQLLQCMNTDKVQEAAAAAAGKHAFINQPWQARQHHSIDTWHTTPLPQVRTSHADAAAAACPSDLTGQQGVQDITGPGGELSLERIGSNSNGGSKNNRHGEGAGLRVSSFGSSSSLTGCSWRRMSSHSMPLPALQPETRYNCRSTHNSSMKRLNSIDQEELLLNLLEDFAPLRR